MSTGSAVARWKPRWPALVRPLFWAGTRQPGLFVAGRCERCGEWFVVRWTMSRAIRWAERRLALALAGVRIVRHPPYCSDFCLQEAGASRKSRKKPTREPARTVLQAGRCAWKKCSVWFTQVVPAAATGPEAGPAYCSKKCTAAARRRRELVNRSKEERRNRRRCPACWARPVSIGSFQQVLCGECMGTVESACRGKARRGTPSNAERVAAARGSWRGKNLGVYECGLCGWWHIGRDVPGRRRRQVQFTVSTFVANAPPDLVERLRLEYAPDRRNLAGPRVRRMR